ncbi:MAG: NAD-dependent epimerase/dehydratase family protein [Lachnospiraceae bacterium]|nr:NAD-dependent epimerase/dehydratase family protein [Lachnospiraceae bacterium]
MNILVTGAKGMVGTALAANLYNLKEGKDQGRPNLKVDEIYEYDLGSTKEELEGYCAKADFVFHLAGVNRPKEASEFMEGNYGFALELLNALRRAGKKAGVMFASSVQAALTGRFGDSGYGRSKRAGEELFFGYGEETGAKVAVYRFPNLMGHSRPNYNSAVSTFCHAVANGLPYQVKDRDTELELLYIDDLVEGMFDLLEGKEKHCWYPGEKGEANQGGSMQEGMVPQEDAGGRYCYIPATYRVKLGTIVDLLEGFKKQSEALIMPGMPGGSFEKKLYSLYLTYLPKEKFIFGLKTNRDKRGSFTELLKTVGHGQFSVNVSRPGATKGEHWHNSKWEIFVVVSGHGLVRERKVGTDEVVEFEVQGGTPQAVYMIPGWTHSLVNLSETEDLVTFMWANEVFDAGHPDTFSEPVG